jgi:hypothetical protein
VKAQRELEYRCVVHEECLHGWLRDSVTVTVAVFSFRSGGRSACGAWRTSCDLHSSRAGPTTWPSSASS